MGKQVVSLYYLLALFLVLAVSGCSTRKLDSNLSSHSVANLPFFAQQRWQCGPASLAGVLNYRGIKTRPDELKDKVYLPKRKGSLQIEMKGAVREANLVPYTLEGGLDSLIKEIKADNPVIVLQNLSFDWYPKWHYAVVKGFDSTSQSILLNSGTRENYSVPIKTFLNTWKRSNYWGLIIMPADKLPQTGTEQSIFKDILVMEQIGKQELAFNAYQQVLKRWPEQSDALFAIGNYYSAHNDLKRAQSSFEKVLHTNPQYFSSWNNLAYVYAKQGCFKNAYQALNEGIKRSSPENQTLLADSLADLQLNEQSINNKFCEPLKLPF